MASGSCVGAFAKFILLLVNLQFIMLSLGLLLVGSRLHMAKTSNTELALGLTESGHLGVSNNLIIAGIILGFISLFGFSAALCESAFLLKVYAYFLLLSVGLFGMLYSYVALLFADSAAESIRHVYRDLMANYTDNGHAQALVHKVQLSLHCCGDQAPEDWHKIVAVAVSKNGLPTNGTTIGTTSGPIFSINSTLPPVSLIPVGYYPASCCALEVNGTSILCPAASRLYNSGCFSQVQLSRYQFMGHCAFIVTLMAILLLVAISCCLERDHSLVQSKLINLQYAAHLETCRAGRLAVGPPAPYYGPNYARNGNF